ncbi:small ribosomal subunit protein mS39-like [Saccostrea echinata]|uniref:small ribosomal subunit protein mS39-like n=1 Tax=Saccostrea echinata TaxID=191078 RepID=UPI002A8021D9|nr:small ribosomal subunit protein mS39-like [Saccostrea echinata]
MGTCLRQRGPNLIFKAKQLQRLQLIPCISCSQLQSSTPRDTYPKIYAPKKINRSPTALLEALEESVGYECRSYGKFSIDDPACYHRQFMKAEMMLSTASGRKAARMMMSMYPEVFEGTPAHVPVEPPTKVFDPIVTKESEDDLEEAIKEQIEQRDVEKVLALCHKIVPEGKTMSGQTLEHLIHFLSFYCLRDHTATEPEEIELLDKFKSEKYLPLDNILNDLFLFEAEKPPAVYNSFIRQYLNSAELKKPRECLKFYETMKNTKTPLERKTYHYILSHAPTLFVSLQEPYKAVHQVLNDMKKAGYHPTVETYNMALLGLKSQRFDSNNSECLDYGLKLIADMKDVGIEPTLDTLSILTSLLDMSVFGKGTSSGVMRVMNLMMDEIEGKRFKDVGPQGRKFIIRALKIALFHQDLDFAYRIDAFYKTGQNYKLLTDHDHYSYRVIMFVLAVYKEPSLSKVVNLYTALQPVDEIRFVNVFRKFIKDLTVTKSYKFIPQLLNSFHAASFNLAEITAFLAKEKQPQLVQVKLAEFVKVKLSELEEKRNVRPKMELLENMLMIAMNGENIELAWKVFSFIITNRKNMYGAEVSMIQPFEGLLDYYISADDLGKCAEIMKFLVKEVPQGVAESLGEKIFTSIPMNELEREQLQRIMKRATIKKRRSNPYLARY